MRILSIQSHVAYGHVGNSAAVFPLQRLGHEVWPVLTVNFSNHTGYGDWRGPLIDPDDVTAVITGIEERGVLASCDAVLSGYQGSPAIAGVVVDAVRRVKAANPAATYTCDPVMGNARSGCFVNPEIPPVIRSQVVPVADVLTPNQFELGFLTDTDPHSLDEVLASADLARAMGPATILVTSVETAPGLQSDSIGLMAVTDDGAWLVETPLLPIKANGSGDLTAALFTAHLHETGSAEQAVARTVSSVYAVLRATIDSGERELRLIAAQDAIAQPGVRVRGAAGPLRRAGYRGGVSTAIVRRWRPALVAVALVGGLFAVHGLTHHGEHVPSMTTVAHTGGGHGSSAPAPGPQHEDPGAMALCVAMALGAAAMWLGGATRRRASRPLRLPRLSRFTAVGCSRARSRPRPAEPLGPLRVSLLRSCRSAAASTCMHRHS